MINFDDYANENKTKHNSKWPYIPDHPYRMLIIGGSGSGKSNAKKRESIELKHFNNPKAFIEYANDMQNVYKNIEEYNLGKNRKILIIFDDMIADMTNNKKT